jgi:hypothetical protein
MIKRIASVIICIFTIISFATPLVATAATTSTDEVAALEARIAELEAEVKMYQDRQAKLSLQMEVIMFESDKIERCDINGDTLIDATDASIILQAYALLSTGEDIQKISQVINYDEIKKLREGS